MKTDAQKIQELKVMVREMADIIGNLMEFPSAAQSRKIVKGAAKLLNEK